MLKTDGIIRKISIRDKLILFMTVMIVVIGLFNLYFYNKAYSSIDDYNKLLKEYSMVNNLSIKLIQGRDSISNYVNPGSGAAGDKSQLKRYNEYTEQVNSLSKEISSSSNSLDTYLLTNSIKNSLETYEDEINKVTLLTPGEEETYLQFFKR